jgi:hypothetical protein
MPIVTESAWIGFYAVDDDSYDGPESSSPVGWGLTEREAIDDLYDQLDEDEML